MPDRSAAVARTLFQSYRLGFEPLTGADLYSVLIDGNDPTDKRLRIAMGSPVPRLPFPHGGRVVHDSLTGCEPQSRLVILGSPHSDSAYWAYDDAARKAADSLPLVAELLKHAGGGPPFDRAIDDLCRLLKDPRNSGPTTWTVFTHAALTHGMPEAHALISRWVWDDSSALMIPLDEEDRRRDPVLFTFLKERPPLCEVVTGFDLRLMSPLNDVSGVPTEGKNLIIVAAVKDVLHFRILDGAGKVVVDTNEKRLTEQAGRIKDLKEQLKSVWPPHELTRSDKGRVIAAVTSIVGHTRVTYSVPRHDVFRSSVLVID
jgi:hypothetical protein